MKIPVANNGSTAIFVGALMVPPGETRLFEEEDVPAHLRPAAQAAPAEPPPSADPAEARRAELSDLLRQPVKRIQKGLKALTDVDLTTIEELEGAAESPRKSLLEAIAEEQLARAGSGG